MPKKCDVGRSWRTYAKHELMNAFIGQEVGVTHTPQFRDVRRLAWYDLSAGDGVTADDVTWYRGCSPGLLAYHAQHPKCAKPVFVVLYEVQVATFSRLCDNLTKQLPYLGYTPQDETSWSHRNNVTICAVNGSGHAASTEWVTSYDAVLVLNDPNAITEWAMRPTFPAELSSRAWCCRTMSTMGCNPAGLKRLPVDERRGWFEHMRAQQAAQPHYRDLLLAAIERDDAQWAYLFSTALAKDWRNATETMVAKAFAKYGRTAELAWWRRDPDQFTAAENRLFLTKKENSRE
jgi:hypothetical protein